MKGMSGQDYNNAYSIPGSYLNPRRYFQSNHYYKQGVCQAERFRVVVWDIDSTFKARRVKLPAEEDAPATDRGYRVDRGADQMVHLMRLHTGAAPVGRNDTQMQFTNYRPVRSMFAKDSRPTDPTNPNEERDWSVETMCFGDSDNGGPGPGGEVCANKACGSGARWCHQRLGADIKTGLDWDAPWQQLPIRGTSDGTFRNNFWQSVCWIDPFAPGSIFGEPGKPGVRSGATYDTAPDGQVSNSKPGDWDGTAQQGVFYPLNGKQLDDANIPSDNWPIGPSNTDTTSYPGLYFRTYTAGSLFPGNSMDLVDEHTAPFFDRGGMTSDKSKDSWDRSRYTVRTPGQEHPVRYFGDTQKVALSPQRVYWGANGGNTACLQPGARNEWNYATDYTKLWNGGSDLNICQKPVSGMASHTCADVNNRTFFGSTDMGRRKMFTKGDNTTVGADGEAWDMRYMFSKSALSTPFYSFPDFYFSSSTDYANYEQDWKYTGPVGAPVGSTTGPTVGNRDTYYLPQKMPKTPFWKEVDGGNVPLGADDPYNGDCPSRVNLYARAVLYMPFFNSHDDGRYTGDEGMPTFKRASSKSASEFWGRPYWATGAGGSMGCHSPANPPWAFPGVVLNDKHGSDNVDCPTTYTAETSDSMTDDCKWAAWAPNTLERWQYDEPEAEQNYWKPQPIFKVSGRGDGKDETGVHRGPPWQEWSFEMLHGWHSQTHMGRVNWGSHYNSGTKFVVDPPGTQNTGKNPHKDTFGTTWKEAHTEGPYPAAGKNDGLLECPSSMLQRNLYWHQNVMQYSLLKKADICLGKSSTEPVDESGLDAKGFARYRDVWSWCVNPANVANDVCRGVAESACGGFNDENEPCVEAVLGYCAAVMSDSRTLAGDEQEYEESGDGGGDRVTEATVRNFCKCNGQGSTLFQAADPGGVFGPGTPPEDIRGDCLCRSLARTARVVVGPNSLFSTPEEDFERPAFLNYTDDDDTSGTAFPFCRCGGADPCLIRRVCKRGLLGNDNSSLGALNGALDATKIGDDGSYEGVDGAIRFDRVPVRYVTRSVPYAGWEMERLNQCASSGGLRNQICEDESVTVPPVAGGAAVSDTNVAVGARFDGLMVENVIDTLAPPTKLTHDGVCATPDPPVADSRDNQLFGDIWGDQASRVGIQKLGDFCVFTNLDLNATTLPGLLGGGNSGETAGLLGYGEVVADDGTTVTTVVMEAKKFEDAKTFPRTTMAKLAVCMMFSIGVIHNDASIIQQFQSQCELDPSVRKKVRLKVPVLVQADGSTAAATVARAVGRCESPGMSSSSYVSDPPQRAVSTDGTTAVFEFTDLCADFVGVFTAGTSSESQMSEVCTLNGVQLLRPGAGDSLSVCKRQSTFQPGRGVCVNRPVAIGVPLSAASDAATTTFTSIGPAAVDNGAFLDVDDNEVEVACANMADETDVQYFLRNRRASLLTLSYGGGNGVQPATRVMTAGEIVGFSAVDFSGGPALASNVLTIDTGRPEDDVELVVCTRTSRDFSRINEDPDAAFDAEITFGDCSDKLTIGYAEWPSDSAVLLDVVGHGANPETSGVTFSLDSTRGPEKPTAVTAYAENPGGGGLVEFEAVPAPCRARDSPLTRNLVTEYLKTTYAFEPGRCPVANEARFCDAGGGAWAIAGGAAVSGTRDDVELDAAGLDWRTVPVQTLAECHTLCLSLAAGTPLAPAAAGASSTTTTTTTAAGAAEAEADAAATCALLHWRAPSVDDHGRCSMLVGAAYHPRVVGAPPGSIPPPVVPFDAAFLGAPSSSESDYLVLCPGQSDPAPGPPGPAPALPVDPGCPDGFLVRPGGQTDAEPICVKPQCPSYTYSNPSQEERPLGTRGPHCGPNEERLSQSYPTVPSAGSASAVVPVQTAVAVTAVPGGNGLEVPIGVLDMHPVAAGESIRVVYSDVSVDMSHLPAADPRAALKALRINLPDAVFVPAAVCECTAKDVAIVTTTTAEGDPPLPVGVPPLPTTRKAVTCESTGPSTSSTTTVGPPAAGQPTGPQEPAPRTTLRVYAKATVTLGETTIASDRVFEFEPFIELEDAKTLFGGDVGTVNENAFGRGTAAGVFPQTTDLTHTIYLDLRDRTDVDIGDTDPQDLTVVLTEICAVARNYAGGGTGDFPEPVDGTLPQECGEFQAILVPGRGVMAQSPGSAYNSSVAAPGDVPMTGECAKPNTVDAHIESNVAGLANFYSEVHELKADFEWCRAVDRLPHGCTTLTLCSPETHFESAAPTPTSDRECAVITRCNADTHYESAAPTPTTDRACTARTACDLNVTFYRTGGSGTSDTVCQHRGACVGGAEFYANTAEAGSDTECVEITQCADDGTEYESASHTVATDRECTTVSEDCPVGTAFKSAEASLTTDRVCTPVSVCISGEAEGTAPTATADRECVPVEEPAPPPDATAERTLPEWSVWTISGAAAAALVVAVAVFGD